MGARELGERVRIKKFLGVSIVVCALDGVRDARFEQLCRHLVLATTKVYPASESPISNLVMEGLK